MTTILPENGALHRALQASQRDSDDGNVPECKLYRPLPTDDEPGTGAPIADEGEQRVDEPSSSPSLPWGADSSKIALILQTVSSGWGWCARLIDLPPTICELTDAPNRQPWPFLALAMQLAYRDRLTDSASSTEQQRELRRRFPGGSAAAWFRDLLSEELSFVRTAHENGDTIAEPLRELTAPPPPPSRGPPIMPQRRLQLVVAAILLLSASTLWLVLRRKSKWALLPTALRGLDARSYAVFVISCLSACIASGLVIRRRLVRYASESLLLKRERVLHCLKRAVLCLMLAQFLRVLLMNHPLPRRVGADAIHHPRHASATECSMISASVAHALRKIFSNVSPSASLADLFHTVAVVTAEEAERLRALRDGLQPSPKDRGSFASFIKLAQLLLPSSLTSAPPVLLRQEQNLSTLLPVLCAAADELIATRLMHETSQHHLRCDNDVSGAPLQPDSSSVLRNGVRVVVARSAAQELVALLQRDDGGDNVNSVDDAAVCRQIDRLLAIREAFLPTSARWTATTELAKQLSGMRRCEVAEQRVGGDVPLMAAEMDTNVEGCSRNGSPPRREELEATGEDEPLFALPADTAPTTQREVHRLPPLPKRSKPLVLEEVYARDE